MNSCIKYFLLTILAVSWSHLTGAIGADGQELGRLDENALEDDRCLQENCDYAVDKTELLDCLSMHCKPAKRWIDTTHYTAGRRSVLDSLERCIRMSCHGKGGHSLKACAVSCSEKRKRSGRIAKKWVDPLNYGMGDEKRSSSGAKRAFGNDVGSEKPGSFLDSFLCDELCGAAATKKPYLCKLRCQQTLEAAAVDEQLSF